jgi:D-serine deaminase-like pyridoxal phosphate-dependent protein
MTLSDLPTPALVLDRARLAANCRRMLERCRALGVKLRPHMKTLKAAEAAGLAVDPGHGGVAASTLNEAAYWAAQGYADIQYAVCLTPEKFGRAARILEDAPRFSVFIDSLEVAQELLTYARTNGAPFRVWVEIDCGGRRTGVSPGGPELLDIARTLAQGPLVFEGVATHAGQSYADVPVAAIADIAEQERAAVVRAAERIEAIGVPVPGRSAGSTPTALHARSAEGLTEYRAGVYMAGDLFQAGIGSVDLDDIAVSVLATVISRDAASGRIVLDAGGLALSKDRSTRALGGRDRGYGLVCDLEGRPRWGDLVVDDVHQEHGVIEAAPPEAFEALPIGARVRILPNHACMTAAAYDRYQVVDGATGVVAEWGRTNGWS